MNTSTKNIYAGISLAVLATLIWSGNYVVARGIIKEMPPVSLGFYRWALASVLIAPLAWRNFLLERKAVWENRKYIFWTALTGVTIFNTFIYLAGHYSPAINLALIASTAAPVFAIILAAIFLHEIIGPLRIVGMVICFVGILYLLSGGRLRSLQEFRFGKGDLLIFISAFSFAVYSILVRKRPAVISPIVFLFVIFTLGTACLFPFYFYEVLHTEPVHWNKNMLLIIFYLGLGNSIISFFCWNSAISRLGASRAALFANLIPVFSAIEAVLFLGEEFSRVHLISGLLIILGLMIANLRTKGRRSNLRRNETKLKS
ncbi:MAG: DMT family transporter [Chitinophagales bacterium]